MISLLRYYRWNKFSILYEEQWVTVALTLENHAKKNNMTVNHQRTVIEGFKCCEEKRTCCAPGFWYQFIQDTKNRTRSELYTLIFNNYKASFLLALFCVYYFLLQFTYFWDRRPVSLTWWPLWNRWNCSRTENTWSYLSTWWPTLLRSLWSI